MELARFDADEVLHEAMMKACHPRHQAIQSRDFVFTRYAP
jgi:hypothetical protein